MEQLNLANEHRNFSTNTFKQYKSNIKKLINKVEEDKPGIDFMEVVRNDHEYILNMLKGYNKSTSQMGLSVIMILLSPKAKRSPEEHDQIVYDIYNIALKDYINTYRNSKGVKNEKEEENWIDYMTLKNTYLKKYKNYTKSIDYENPSSIDKQNLLHYLLLGLYLYVPPRRLDYSNMFFIDKKAYNKMNKEDKMKYNFVVMLKKPLFFSWSVVKSPTAEPVIVDIPKELKTIMSNYMLLHNKIQGDALLTIDNMPISSNRLTKELNKIFKPKKISASMLRKIYTTYKYGDTKQEMKEDAIAMNHSVQTQQDIYVK